MVAELKPISRDGARPPVFWQRALGVLGALALGGVLLFAAYAKLLDPLAFAEQIHAEKLDAWLPAHAVALIALALEVALGLALLLNLRRLWVLLPAAALVAFFLFLTGRAWYLDAHGLRQEAASCGCFGNLVERTPAEAFRQDALLLVPPLLLAFLGRPRRAGVPKGRLVLIGVTTLGATMFAVAAPNLPLDDLATRLHVGARIAERCTGQGTERVCLSQVVPEIRAGRHVVILADLADPRFGEVVPRLNDYAIAGQGPHLWVLTSSSPEAQRTFQWTKGPAFDLREAPAPLIRPLYRTLPRSFLVRDGVVEKTFRDLPPLDELRPPA